MDRKAELERKKAKLAAIREEKERRRREKEVKDMEDATTKLAIGPEKDSRRYVNAFSWVILMYLMIDCVGMFFFSNSDLDEMLSSLGVAPVSEVLSSLSSVNSMASDNSANATPDGSLQPTSLNGTQ